MEERKMEDTHGSLAACSKSTSMGRVFIKKGSKIKHEGLPEVLARRFMSNLGCLACKTGGSAKWSAVACQMV
jgi:hypothetical protein